MGALSTRQRVSRKIARFSLALGASAILLTASVYVTTTYREVRRAQMTNQRALQEIACQGGSCDIQKFMGDGESDGPDYIIETDGRFLIAVAGATVENPGIFPPLNYADTGFIAKFRQPQWYNAPDGEVWRLYSETSEAGKDFDIVVGYQNSSPWKIARSCVEVTVVDNILKHEAK